MIGVTPTRTSFFMNKFRRLGFIEYDGGFHVHNSLLNVLLYDKSPRDAAAFSRRRSKKSLPKKEQKC